MKKKIILHIVFFLILILLLAVNAVLFLQRNRVKIQAKALDKIITKIEKDNKQLELKYEEKNKELEKLQVAINHRSSKFKLLEAQIQNFKTQLDRMIADIKDKDTALQESKRQIAELKKDLRNSELQSSSTGELQEKLKALQYDLELKEEALLREKATYYYNLSVIHFKNGNYDKALEALFYSLEIDNTNADAHYNCAYIYETIKKDKERSLHHYSKYLELVPESEDVEEIRKRLLLEVAGY